MSEKKSNSQKTAKPWPKNCLWPEPVKPGEGFYWEDEDADLLPLDETGEELYKIKKKMDKLVEAGILDEDYMLRINDLSFLNQEQLPDNDYWSEDGFEYFLWREDFIDHINLLKLPIDAIETHPVIAVRRAIDYDFVNENILRQAFTRRAFGIEYGTGDCEVLEFIGDSILNLIVTREIEKHLTETEEYTPHTPFRSYYDEGEMTRIRSHFVSKEHLSKRASELELDQYILYGSNETESDSAKEDMIEALIGAVAEDSNWNWNVLNKVVDKLICIQLTKPDRFLKQTYYDLFNSWHQKRFGFMPSYSVYGIEIAKNEEPYDCVLRFRIPDNHEGIHTSQIVTSKGSSRSKAREKAAFNAYAFVVNHGLLIRLEDAHLIPSTENSINQLQELYQKKYVDSLPQYSFDEFDELWKCDCICGGVNGYGQGKNKIAAKKKAAYMVLVRLLDAAGICKEEWKEQMWENMTYSE